MSILGRFLNNFDFGDLIFHLFLNLLSQNVDLLLLFVIIVDLLFLVDDALGCGDDVLEALGVNGVDPPIVYHHIQFILQAVHLPLGGLFSLDVAHHTYQHVEQMDDHDKDPHDPEQPQVGVHGVLRRYPGRSREVVQAWV